MNAEHAQGFQQVVPVRLASRGAAAAQRVFLVILRMDSVQSTWRAVWVPRSEGDLAGQSRMMRRQHEGHGWEVFADIQLALATRPAAHDAISWTSHQHRSKLLLIIGEGVKPSQVAQSPARASLGVYARSRMAPSREAITWLKAMAWSILTWSAIMSVDWASCSWNHAGSLLMSWSALAVYVRQDG